MTVSREMTLFVTVEKLTLRLYFFMKTFSRINSIIPYPSLQTSVTSVKGIIPAGPPDRLPLPSSCICGALGSPPEKLVGHPSCKPSFWKHTWNESTQDSNRKRERTIVRTRQFDQTQGNVFYNFNKSADIYVYILCKAGFKKCYLVNPLKTQEFSGQN